MSTRSIPIATPVFNGNEKKYVADCMETAWISGTGKYIERFESSFADFCDVDYAISCSNGTTALHLALLAVKVGRGDEVICPTFTYVATANSVTYCGATPVFVDSEPETWNMDPQAIEQKITQHTKAIIVVHIYGQPVDMDPVMEIARKHGLSVIEDAAEALGAQYKSRTIGSIGDIATFSFYGNKTITTGEGGMVVTKDESLANTVRQLRGQGVDPDRRYWFPVIGYNYRMTNLAAAIGLAQLEDVEWHTNRRLEIADWYKEELRGASGIMLQAETDKTRHAHWMFTIMLKGGPPSRRDELMERMLDTGVETRPGFYPIHSLPPYANSSDTDDYLVATRIALQTISLPTSAALTRSDIAYVCTSLVTSLVAMDSFVE
jgi:perosamine synthetase